MCIYASSVPLLVHEGGKLPGVPWTELVFGKKPVSYSERKQNTYGEKKNWWEKIVGEEIVFWHSSRRKQTVLPSVSHSRIPKYIFLKLLFSCLWAVTFYILPIDLYHNDLIVANIKRCTMLCYRYRVLEIRLPNLIDRFDKEM